MFNENDLVEFDDSVCRGKGIVRGISNSGVVFLGKSYIIDVLESSPTIPNETYPFSFLSVFEKFMKHVKE